jgi:hypothetical protein
MEKALQEFYANKTDIQITKITLFLSKRHLEKLHKERNLIKQTSPLDEECLQENTDIMNSSYEVILALEEKLQKQQQTRKRKLE